MASPLIVDPQDIPPSDYEQVSSALRDFYARAHRVVDRMMTTRGVSFARAKLLMHIVREGPLRSTDLADTFGYAPRTVTEAIDGLERDGLVRRDPDPDDRRAKRISLTPDGEKAAAASEAIRLEYMQALFGVLDAGERAEIVRLVGKLNDRLAGLEL
jgi:DNA-binding MarR family transcriptional regulator